MNVFVFLLKKLEILQLTFISIPTVTNNYSELVKYCFVSNNLGGGVGGGSEEAF